MQHVFDFSTIAAGSQVGIKESSIPNSARGLFSYINVREGKTIGEYFGWEVEKDHDYGEVNDLIASYSMGNRDGSIIYCAFHLATQAMLCMMGYINDPLNDMMCNVRAIWNGPRCRIVTTRDIIAGEEFLMAYGDDYWLRDIWPLNILHQAWDNYGTRRTLARWTEVVERRTAIELAEEESSVAESESEDSEESEASLWQSDWEEEEEVVFPERTFREIVDLTQGDEPVIIMEEVAVLPAANAEEPEEEYVVVRNSCA